MSNLQRLVRTSESVDASLPLDLALQVLLERDSEAELRLRDSPLHKILAKLEK